MVLAALKAQIQDLQELTQLILTKTEQGKYQYCLCFKNKAIWTPKG